MEQLPKLPKFSSKLFEEAKAVGLAAVIASIILGIGIFVSKAVVYDENKQLHKSIKGTSSVAMEYFKLRGYQPRFFSEGKDFDHDGMDDPYIQIREGKKTITYSTNSMNLVRGYEDINIRTWSRRVE